MGVEIVYILLNFPTIDFSLDVNSSLVVSTDIRCTNLAICFVN
jgi:hypothetical protein